MGIVSTDKIKYETRVPDIIAFGCPWPYPSNQILNYYKYKLSQQNPLPMICIYKTVIVLRVQTVKPLARQSSWDAASKH